MLYFMSIVVLMVAIIWTILFIIQRHLSKQEESQTAIPLLDTEILNLKKSFSEQGSDLQPFHSSENLISHQETAKNSQEKLQVVNIELLKQREDYEHRIQELTSQIQNLKDVLRREISSKTSSFISEDSKKITTNNEQQIKKLQQACDALTEESLELKSEIKNKEHDLKELLQLRAELKQRDESDKNKNQGWENQLSVVKNQLELKQKDCENLLKTLEKYEAEKKHLEHMIEQKAQELDKIQSDFLMAQQSLAERKLEYSKEKDLFESEVKHLKKELDSKNLQNTKLKEDSKFLTEEIQTKLKLLKEHAVSKLKEQEIALEEAQKIIEKLQSSKTVDHEQNVFLSELENLREFKQSYSLREQKLNQELLRFRTRALGLERVCDDLKSKVEEQGRDS